MNEPLIKFPINSKNLTKNQQNVLKYLIGAVELIANLYQEQENPEYPGANFYPHDLSREEIAKAAESNPEILSPYTIVEKSNGKITAIPYHVKYAQQLKPIAEKLVKASEITENIEFGKRLKKQADALLTGNYDEATVYWMSMKPYIIDINIGPIERYNDQLFFIKTAYQAWVGIMDEDNTKKLVDYKDNILSTRRKSLLSSEKVDYSEKVQMRVDEVFVLSGLISRTNFVGVNLPNEIGLIKKYGSEITIFKQNNQIRHQENWPVFQKLFSSDFKQQFTSEDLESGSLYSTAFHELAHAFLRYQGSERRLQEFFPVIDELSATVLGMKMGGILLLKDIITQKQLESILLTYLTRSFYNISFEKGNQPRKPFLIGGAIFINFLMESGAIRVNGGLSWPNFTKMFLSIDQLSLILEKLLAYGSREDAGIFISRYGNIDDLRSLN